MSNADAQTEGRLVVVSNREPYTLNFKGTEIRLEKTPGGLVSALDPVLRRRNGIWICWEGAPLKSLEFDDVSVLSDDIDWRNVEVPYAVKSVALSAEEINHYYYGYANNRIWPLFHYFISRCDFFDERDWPAYLSANQKFASSVIENTTDDDWIWVQDYHLMLVPEMVRQSAPGRRLGFFLHIPFPSVEVFRILPRREAILRGLLGCDVIGFHCPDYVRNFMESVERLLPASEVVVDVAAGAITYLGRVVKVADFPISIDFEQIDIMVSLPRVQETARDLRAKYDVDWIGISVDRLDYSKGILENLEAIRVFFEKYPEYRKRFSFIQIAAPTRTEVPAYQKMREDIDQAVGRINGALSEDNWTPIHYYYRSFPMDEVLPFFMISDVAMITPLRDGMNLVAKEYCAAKRDLQGVLLLSEFTGAAAEMTEAVLINPFYIEQVADRLQQALHMPKAIKAERMLALRERVRKCDIHHWLQSFMKAFEDAIADRT